MTLRGYKKKYGTDKNLIEQLSVVNTDTDVINGVHCRDWIGPRRYMDRDDYGVVSWWYGEKRERGAHRISYIAHNGDLPKDKSCVCHHCDRRICVEPLHLYAGTNTDNVRDRDARGRGLKGRKMGPISDERRAAIKAAHAKEETKKKCSAASKKRRR